MLLSRLTLEPARRTMAETFFSEFLMVDRPASRPPARAAVRRDRDDVSGGEARVRFVAAFRRALEEVAPDEVPPELAEAAADLALGRSVALRLNPTLAERQRDAVRSFLASVVRVSASLDESRLEAAIGKLAEVLLPDEGAEARGILASDNLELRDRFVAEVPHLTSAEVGARAGLRTTNPYATAARWKKAGEIFSVQHRGREHFPAFQFRDGRPHPTIKRALAALPPGLSPWQRAIWFVSTNGWLDDAAPADRLDEAEAVVAAAQHEDEEVVG